MIDRGNPLTTLPPAGTELLELNVGTFCLNGAPLGTLHPACFGAADHPLCGCWCARSESRDPVPIEHTPLGHTRLCFVGVLDQSLRTCTPGWAWRAPCRATWPGVPAFLGGGVGPPDRVLTEPRELVCRFEMRRPREGRTSTPIQRPLCSPLKVLLRFEGFGRGTSFHDVALQRCHHWRRFPRCQCRR